MGDKPIIFSAPMVRALLDGRKTQTRRVLKPQPEYLESSGRWKWSLPPKTRRNVAGGSVVTGSREFWEYAPNGSFPYAVGDRLYVREQCAIWGRGPEREPVEFPVVYAADDAEWADIKHDARNSKTGDEWKIRPSIHMPRWASRLTLTVTDVRVQRLQDITNEDCIAEGVPIHPNANAPRSGPTADDFARNHGLISHYGHAFRTLWNSLHGPDAWDANPWVVAVSFTVQRGNIDQIGGTHD